MGFVPLEAEGRLIIIIIIIRNLDDWKGEGEERKMLETKQKMRYL